MAEDLYCSQYKDVDPSTMGTAIEVDGSGNTIRRSRREKIQWVHASSGNFNTNSNLNRLSHDQSMMSLLLLFFYI